MSAPPSPRVPRAGMRRLMLLSAAALALGLSACNITWTAGKTHGAIIETSAARASIGIWRAPTRVLYDVYGSAGITTVQDILCAHGTFPTLRLAVGKRSVSSDALKKKWCGYVRGDGADLRGALIDAQRQRDNCLALTLISSGAYIKNWTHKSAGCKTGSLQ